MHKKISVLIIGPSADYTAGSLLRPLNIWYALKAIKGFDVSYLPVRSVIDIVVCFWKVLKPNIVILSGVNPWVSALIVLFRHLLKRTIIVDVHGFAWLESTVFGENLAKRVLLLISESLAYKHAHCLVTASTWLAKTINHYFDRAKHVYVIENSTTYLFEQIVERLRNIGISNLRALISELFGLPLDKPIFIAPLPGVFASNYYAFRELLRLGENDNSGYMVVTGFKCNGERILCLGYVPYVHYVVLLMIADAVILPYPKNAICGGARNKILEAIYLYKPIISTPTGMMHIDAKPGIHYTPIEDIRSIENIIKHISNRNTKVLETLRERHTFKMFKRTFLQTLARCSSRR